MFESFESWKVEPWWWTGETSGLGKMLLCSLVVGQQTDKALQLHLFFSPFNSFVMLGINTIAVSYESLQGSNKSYWKIQKSE